MKLNSLLSLLIILLLGFLSCKSTKTTATENSGMNQSELTEKHWKLVELNGLLVNETSREPFIVFEKEGHRVHGNTSCNNLFGIFELPEKNKIKFSQVGMTKMACIGNNIETPFIQALESATAYKIEKVSLLLFDESGTIKAQFTEEIRN
ncbi:MAG TPA: hypothetical protein DHV48_06820 [Prolixibacteraceae bacterium]|nr:hypothetical protein [Prolixibacteraceae bacterium]